MALTEAQIEERKKHLGSSDVAAILGLDPFRNAGDVFLEKTGKLKEQVETDVMKRGHYIEPAILNYAEVELGPLARNIYYEVEGLPLASNVDAQVLETGNPVEAKSVGAFVNEFWGEAGTDEIPDRVIIQSHVHMICTNKGFCHIPVYLAYREFQMFGIPFDNEVKNIICEKAIDFWDNYVQKDIPPEGVTPALEVIKRIKREPETTVDVEPEIVAAWLKAKEEKLDAEKVEKERQATLLKAMGTAEGGRCGLGLTTYLEQTRSGIDSKALKADEPDIAKKYAKVSKYRVLRFKKAK